MALLRFVNLPSATHHHQFVSFAVHNPYPSAFLCVSPILKHRRLNLFQPQAQSTIQTVEKQQEAAQTNELQEEEEVSTTRLLAQNVPWTCTADDLRPLFEQYGTVLGIELSMYNKTRNRGLAFVTMASPEEAQAAFNNLESYEFEGRILKLAWAKPKKKPIPPQPKPMPIHNLYVANVPFQARANDLKEFFNKENANVFSAEIIFQDKPRRSAGYGFVSFNTKEEAEAALAAFQGKEFMGRPIRVAQSKKFLRQETKATIQSESATRELSSEQSETANQI